MSAALFLGYEHGLAFTCVDNHAVLVTLGSFCIHVGFKLLPDFGNGSSSDMKGRIISIYVHSRHGCSQPSTNKAGVLIAAVFAEENLLSFRF